MLTFKNQKKFRHVLVFSLLSGQKVSIQRDEPFERYELQFVYLLEKVTKGSGVYMVNGNRRIDFKPGSIEQSFENKQEVFDCGVDRSIVYFMEPVVLLGLFSKDSIELTFKGITNDNIDISIDCFRNGFIPLLQEIFADKEVISFKLKERGFRVKGQGEVDIGIRGLKKGIQGLVLPKPDTLIKRIRGTAVVSKVSIDFANKMISKLRGIFNDFIPDVWIYSDQVKNGPDRFFGVSLWTNNFVVSDFCYDELDNEVKDPEQVAEIAAKRLLEEIYTSQGCICGSFQSLVLILIALSKNGGQIKLDKITENSAWILRYLKAFFGAEFKIDQEETGFLNLQTRGVGLANRFAELK